jgi:hypothetical protein
MRYIRWYQCGSIFGSIANREENRGAIGGNHLYDSDQGMQAI